MTLKFFPLKKSKNILCAVFASSVREKARTGETQNGAHMPFATLRYAAVIISELVCYYRKKQNKTSVLLVCIFVLPVYITRELLHMR